MTITQYVKDISYDRETRDYAMRLDGELVGFARTHHEAEVALDQIVFELLSAQPIVADEPPQLPIVDTCPSCGDPLPDGARLCAACRDDEPARPDLTTRMYSLLCLMLSGTAGAATVLTLARELVERYESEVK